MHTKQNRCMYGLNFLTFFALHVFVQAGLGVFSSGSRTPGFPDAAPQLCSPGQQPKEPRCVMRCLLWKTESTGNVALE